MEKPFRPGEVVVCVKAEGAHNLVNGKLYVVQKCWDDFLGGAVLVFGADPNPGDYAFWPSRFRLYEPPKQQITEKIVDKMLPRILQDILGGDKKVWH